MNVYQPLRRSVAALLLTATVVIGAQAVAQIAPASYTSASNLPTISAVSVSPTCVAAPHSTMRRICYQANVIVGEPMRLEANAASTAR
jgi:tetrahydromethanopterin S-methyltransferase subunit C